MSVTRIIVYIWELIAGSEKIYVEKQESYEKQISDAWRVKWELRTLADFVWQASDANTRVLSQAASHSTTQIDQQAVDNMVSVQYLLGTSNSR